MIVQLLTEHHLEFLSLTGGCKGSSESNHVKMTHCWKSHATAQIGVCINSDQPTTYSHVLVSSVRVSSSHYSQNVHVSI